MTKISNAKEAFCALMQMQGELLKTISLSTINIDDVIENLSTLQTIVADSLFDDFQEFKEIFEQSKGICNIMQVPNHDEEEILYDFNKEARA